MQHSVYLLAANQQVPGVVAPPALPPAGGAPAAAQPTQTQSINAILRSMPPPFEAPRAVCQTEDFLGMMYSLHFMRKQSKPEVALQIGEGAKRITEAHGRSAISAEAIHSLYASLDAELAVIMGEER